MADKKKVFNNLLTFQAIRLGNFTNTHFRAADGYSINQNQFGNLELSHRDFPNEVVEFGFANVIRLNWDLAEIAEEKPVEQAKRKRTVKV